MMERFEDGLVWEWHQHPEIDEILLFLMDDGMIESREDIQKDWLQLTQRGHACLEAYRKQCAEAEKEQREKEAAETLRLNERAEDSAAEERRHKEQKSTAIKSALITGGCSLLSFILGMIFEARTGAVGQVVQVVVNLH